MTAEDDDGNTIAITAGVLPDWLTFTDDGNGSGTLSGTPANGDVGVHGVALLVSDGNGGSATQAFAIDVNGLNDPPAGTATSLTTPEDTPLPITLAGADVDLAAALTFTVATQPARGTLSGTAPTLLYTPAANFTGTDSFTFTVSDGTATSAATTVNLTVTPVNDAPVALAAAASTSEDTPVAITLTGNDVDGDTLTFALDAAPTRGTAVLAGNVVTYTPAANTVGTDSFTFHVSDGTLASATATVNIVVGPIGDAPVAFAQSASLDEDTDVALVLVGLDADNDALAFATGTGPANGTVAIVGDVAIYTPFSNFNGTDTFTFVATDGTTQSAPATVTLTVRPINDRPVAASAVVTTDEDTVATITLVGTDIDGDTLTFALDAAPTRGTAVLAGNVVTYTPTANVVGPDSFTFHVSDGTLDSATATVNIVVGPVGDVPVAFDQSASLDEDADAPLVLTGLDADNDDLDFAIETPPENGSVTVVGNVAVYTPFPDFNGTDSFTFVATDGTTDSAPATVSLTVNPVNDAPTAISALVTIDEDVVATITLAGADIDGDTFTFALDTQPANGTVTLAGAVATYVPNANFRGTDTFTFHTNDGSLSSAIATVTVTINSANDAPVGTAQTVATAEDTVAAITLSGTDNDGDALTFTVVQPANGTLSGTPPTLLYTPNLNFNGTDTFTFTANDGTATSLAATVTIEVTPVNDAPVALADAVATGEDTAANVTLEGADVDSGTLTFAVATQPASGTVTLVGAVATYTPAADFNGTDSFTFTVSDGALTSAPAVINVVVGAADDAPIAFSQTVTVDEDDSVGFRLTGVDPDGSNIDFFVTSDPANGFLSVTGSNVFYTPFPDFNGTDSFTFFVNDGTSDSPEATITLNVISINDAPVAFDVNASGLEDTVIVFDLAGSDIEGTPLTFTATSAANGRFTLVGRTVTYTPNANFNGQDSFTFIANDGEDDSGEATAFITVVNVDDQPSAVDDTLTTEVDLTLVVDALELLGNDLDADGDGLQLGSVFGATNGTVRLQGTTITFVPTAGFIGDASFRYTLAGGSGTFDVGDVTVSVTAATCGNGVAQTGEECDDGSLSSGDGCSDLCVIEFCGDGVTNFAASPPVSVTFEWLNDSCEGPINTDFFVNGQLVASVPSDAPCDCNAPIESVTVSDPGVLAAFVQGANELRMSYGPGPGIFVSSWAIASIDTGAGVQEVVIFDDGDGDAEARNPDALCESDFFFNIDTSVTASVASGRPELCDDGNGDEDDGCTTACVPTGCGNGVIDAGLPGGLPDEVCDDGNNLPGDACAPDCSATTFCGDNDLDAGEQCDDGGNVDGDSCSAACEIELCGNGIVGFDENGLIEACDDGNTDDFDGCDAACVIEFCGDGTAAPSLPAAALSVSWIATTCDADSPNGGGEPAPISFSINGQIVHQELSDASCQCVAAPRTVVLDATALALIGPGNNAFAVDFANTGGVNELQALGWAVFTLQAGNLSRDVFAFDAGLGAVRGDLCTNAFGDSVQNSVVDTGVVRLGEECDDGNTDDGDGCSATCDLERCGDGDLDFLDPGTVEECDDGNADDGDGCSTACILEFCGDGTVQAGLGEECDGTPGCDPNCRLTRCGNGFVGLDGAGQAEQCDDGNNEPNDRCGPTCAFERCGDRITNVTTAAVSEIRLEWLATECGGDTNTVWELNGTQILDAANTGAICDCVPGAQFASLTDPGVLALVSLDDVNTFRVVIGDAGTVAAWAVATVVMSDGSQVEVFPFDGGGGVSREPDLCLFSNRPGVDETVGNFIAAGLTLEQCDDGVNGDDTDGCNDQCQTTVCGDGDVDVTVGETCDDGNTVPNDGCGATCVIEVCGDNILQQPPPSPARDNVAESEPNDDGSPGNSGEAFGDDFDPNTVNGPFTNPNTTIALAIEPSGDEDWFAFTNASVNTEVLAMETFIGAVGECGPGDTIIAVRNADGSERARDDDGSDLPGLCSRLTLDLAPGETIFIGVFGFRDTITFGPAFLQLSTQAVLRSEECDGEPDCDTNCTFQRCGNGVQANDENGQPEECDDGNNNPNDGCGPTCALERCGDGIASTRPEAVIGIQFTWIATSCDGDVPTISFLVDGVAVASGTGAFNTCSCLEGVQSLFVNDPAALAAFADGSADLGVLFEAQFNAAFGWAQATIFTETAATTTTIADFTGFPGAEDGICLGGAVPFVDAVVTVATPVTAEQCDDGNGTNGDGCDDDERNGGNCTFTGCGNGVQTSDEQCDDGNPFIGDGCSDLCTVEFCGDGTAQFALGEVCDDGNGVTGDGCDDGPLGNCTPSACGNGVTAGTEACDDGNSDELDACNNDCTIDLCRNNQIDAGEQCDDGNIENNDDCRNDCTDNLCGNNSVDPGEDCDDGNRIGGDACPATCVFLFTFSGVSQNVPEADLTGWSECFVDDYGSFSDLNTILASCGTGSQMLMGCRVAGSSDLQLAAHAPIGDVMFDTGSGDFSTTHEANGVGWYFADNWSWGFVPAGVTAFKSSCDIPEGFGDATALDQRMCWHTGSNAVAQGFRCGADLGLGDGTFERVIYTNDPNPPPPFINIGGGGEGEGEGP